VSAKRIEDLADLTVHGIWEPHLKGERASGCVVDDVVVRAAGVLAERGYWTWMFQAATEDIKCRVWDWVPERGYRAFLTLHDQGYAESCKRISENPPSRKLVHKPDERTWP
jgi:hypothetical protein